MIDGCRLCNYIFKHLQNFNICKKLKKKKKPEHAIYVTNCQRETKTVESLVLIDKKKQNNTHQDTHHVFLYKYRHQDTHHVAMRYPNSFLMTLFSTI